MTVTALKFLVIDPGVVVQNDLKHIALTFEIVQQVPEHHQRSENAIHLGMTTEAAMTLLAQLKYAQQQLGLEESATPVELLVVPPTKDRS